MPAIAHLDALHLAVATVNGMQSLMTWNCKHLADAMLWRKIGSPISLISPISNEHCSDVRPQQMPPTLNQKQHLRGLDEAAAEARSRRVRTADRLPS
jgi:hypothetical protein